VALELVGVDGECVFGKLLPFELIFLVGGVEHLEFAHVFDFGPDALDVHDFGSWG